MSEPAGNVRPLSRLRVDGPYHPRQRACFGRPIIRLTETLRPAAVEQVAGAPRIGTGAPARQPVRIGGIGGQAGIDRSARGVGMRHRDHAPEKSVLVVAVQLRSLASSSATRRSRPRRATPISPQNPCGPQRMRWHKTSGNPSDNRAPTRPFSIDRIPAKPRPKKDQKLGAHRSRARRVGRERKVERDKA